MGGREREGEEGLKATNNCTEEGKGMKAKYYGLLVTLVEALKGDRETKKKKAREKENATDNSRGLILSMIDRMNLKHQLAREQERRASTCLVETAQRVRNGNSWYRALRAGGCGA